MRMLIYNTSHFRMSYIFKNYTYSFETFDERHVYEGFSNSDRICHPLSSVDIIITKKTRVQFY